MNVIKQTGKVSKNTRLKNDASVPKTVKKTHTYHVSRNKALKRFITIPFVHCCFENLGHLIPVNDETETFANLMP